MRWRTSARLSARVGATPVEVRVLVNGAGVGVMELGPGLALSRIQLPGELFVAQRNRVALVRTAGAGEPLDLIAAWLEPTATSLLVPVATPASAALTRGFGPPGLLGARRASHVTRYARVSGSIEPLPVDYVTLLVGRSVGEALRPIALGLSLNQDYVGELTLTPAWGTSLLDTPAARVPRGKVELELLLTQAQDGEAAIEWVGLTPLRPSVLLDVGDPTARPFIHRGLSFDERSEGRTTAWSEGASTAITLLLQPTSDDYVLSLALEAFAPLAPLAVGVSVNGRKLGSVPAVRTFAVRELATPHGLLQRGANELVLSYPRVLKPAAASAHSTDQRELAVMLDWLEVRPSSLGAPLAEALP